jgi:hypothetical protein
MIKSSEAQISGYICGYTASLLLIFPSFAPTIEASDPKLPERPLSDASGARTTVEVYSFGILKAMTRATTNDAQLVAANSFLLVKTSVLIILKSTIGLFIIAYVIEKTVLLVLGCISMEK